MTTKTETRTLVNEIVNHIGETITLKGWVSQYRELKKFSFIILRDRSGYCSIFVPKDKVVNLLSETVVEITGLVKKEEQSKYNGVEIVANEIKVISDAEALPFPISREEDLPPFNTLNLFRPLTLRKEKERSIFKIQSEIINSFRDFMRSQDFVEINSTKLSASGLEGGANMFEVNYFDNKMYLTQSPQFYKQIMVGAYERVFEIGKVYRAEGSNTNRHMAEYIGLDFEMGFIKTQQEVMDMEEKMLFHVLKQLQSKCSKELEYLNSDLPAFVKIPRLHYNEIFHLLEENGELRLHAHMYQHGINSEIEKWISDYVKNFHNSDFVFVYGYPLKEKPFYTMPSVETIHNDGKEHLTESFDLLYKGMEITSGGQRIHQYKKLTESLEAKGLKPENYESYLMAFKYGMPPHGGCGIGLERVMMQLLNLNSVQECSLIPRTREKTIH